MITPPLVLVAPLPVPSQKATPATPAASRINHGSPTIGVSGAEFGLRHGLHPGCERFPATAVVPAATCLSLAPTLIVTRPVVVSTWVCEHSTSTRKLSAWPESAMAVASLVVTVVATPAELEK